MRQIPRSILTTLILVLSLFGCSEQPIPDPQQDLGQQECPKPPEMPQNPFAGFLHVSCQGINAATGSPDWIDSPTYGQISKDVYGINWQPICVMKGDMYTCAAPPQIWWGGYLTGNVTCFVSPCEGKNPSQITWANFLTGEQVLPQQSPRTLPPMNMLNQQAEPQGGGGPCLDPANAWVFTSQQ